MSCGRQAARQSGHSGRTEDTHCKRHVQQKTCPHASGAAGYLLPALQIEQILPPVVKAVTLSPLLLDSAVSNLMAGLNCRCSSDARCSCRWISQRLNADDEACTTVATACAPRSSPTSRAVLLGRGKSLLLLGVVGTRAWSENRCIHVGYIPVRQKCANCTLANHRPAFCVALAWS